MNTFKKVGLTALAGSLVVSSAMAGEMSVSGGASIGLKNTSKTSTGKSWTMGNQLTFTGSGELDNGLNVSLSMVIDQNDDSTKTTAAQLDNAPFDSHSVTVSSDSLGTLVFAGEGGSSAQSSIDTTAAGDLWNNGSGFTSPMSAEAGNNSLFYTLPSMVDDVTVNASYSPGGAGGASATSFGVGYTGVEGLTLNYAVGDTETVGKVSEHTTMKASYAYSSFTVSYSDTSTDVESTSTTKDEDITSWQIAYTVTDDLSVSYGSEVIDTEGQTVDEEATGFNVSYTSGGVTLSATQYNFEGSGNTAGTAGEKDRWALSATFAF
jgi:outer membrane protein OmpU